MVITWRRKVKRSTPATHWAVLLSAHGVLVIMLHVGQVITHLGGALVLTAMAERIIWDASDSVALRIDKFIERLANRGHSRLDSPGSQLRFDPYGGEGDPAYEQAEPEAPGDDSEDGAILEGSGGDASTVRVASASDEG